jgi:uncharacterized membrane protein YfcA
MALQTVFTLLLVGLISGLLSGLIGIGGGIVIVPALMLILGYTQTRAQGTSLGLLLLPVGILAVINYYKNGDIDIKVVLIMSVTFILGGWLGSKIALNISQTALKRVFAIILMGIAAKMLFFDK